MNGGPVPGNDADFFIRQHITGGISATQSVFARCRVSIAEAARQAAECLRSGGKLLLCGDAGSVPFVQQLAGEFVHAGRGSSSAGLPAIALTTGGFTDDGTFERQVQALGRAGDVVIGVSATGNQENVFRALRRARSLGMTAICLTGESAGRMRTVSDLCIAVPSGNAFHIRESHVMLGHIIYSLTQREIAAIQHPEKAQPALLAACL